MKRLAAALAFSAAGAAIFAASMSLAADLRVLLLGPSATDPTVVRVRQELMLLGLDVEVETAPAKVDLAALAREHGAAAVARVEDAPPEIVLWVDTAHSGGQPQESRVSEGLAGRADPGLLALRAVELLRGRLLPVPAATASSTASVGAGAPPAPTGSAVASPTASASASAAPSANMPVPTASVSVSPTSELPPARRPRGSLHLGPAIVASPGGVPVTPALRVGGGWRLSGPLEIEGLAMIPLATGTVAAGEGQIDLRVLAFGAGLSLRFVDVVAALSLHAGAGAGIAGFLFEGRASAPWVGTSGSQWSALPYLDVGAGYRFSPVLSVRADVLAALARPEPVLVIAEREIASFGTPAIFGSLSLEVHP